MKAIMRSMAVVTVASMMAACGGHDGAQAPQGNGELHPFDVTEEFDHNPFSCLRGAGMLLAAGNADSSNAMTIGWGQFGTLWRVPALTVYVYETRHTYHYMEESDYFTVMAFDDPKVLEYMGSHSGCDGDKAEALGLHTRFTEHGTPYYAEASMVIECRKMYQAPFDKSQFKGEPPINFYATHDKVHHMYVGEVVSALKR